MSELIIAPPVSEAPQITITNEGLRLRDELLADAKLVGDITDTKVRDRAIIVSSAIGEHIKLVEASRKEVLKPFHEVVRTINKTAEDHIDVLDKERKRINREVGEFEHDQRVSREMAQRNIQQEAARLAEQSRRLGGTEEEGPRDGKTLMEVFAAEEKREELLQQSVAIAEEGRDSKAKGGMLRQDWEISVVDPDALYKAHPQCVELKPRLMAIKDLLKAGITPPGVWATPKHEFATRSR